MLRTVYHKAFIFHTEIGFGENKSPSVFKFTRPKVKVTSCNNRAYDIKKLFEQFFLFRRLSKDAATKDSQLSDVGRGRRPQIDSMTAYRHPDKIVFYFCYN